ncbi:FAD-binding domain-containing protein [Fomitopsis serialis]|uniref:FAD-binding domain-containing protein n=1 Tax=Fomitopsis serialis TaxID=139415 RepID=UPI00200858C4|nr:FAD-binding domain-containing protein [Neoantrodia serialis]KAH9931579.1 FAD-binding domain-containing protein [Neoantrodia serialis]
MLVLPLLSAVAVTVQPRSLSTLEVCGEIASAVSSASEVFYPLELYYTEDNYHWAQSSSQVSACTVEPGTAEDVGAILQVIARTQTPFAVKGGGHSANPEFSSTTGVQIAMARFNDVTYDSSAGTATIGAGLIWDDVYAALEPYNVNVVGGRVTGVGVAGFTLGGGFSFLSNQYGLTIDSVRAFELVLPNGTFTTVTDSNPDLFWALKGGFNNFGIVTQFVLETHPQGQVWVRRLHHHLGRGHAVKNATANFYANVTDPKASILTTLNWELGITAIELNLFYDAPTPPDGIFDELLAIPFLTQDISTRSFLSLVLTAPSNATFGLRGYFDTVSITDITLPLLDAVVNETEYWATTLAAEVPGLFVSYDIEPFLPSVYSHGASSAWPPTRTQGFMPINIYYAWSLEASDSLINSVMQESARYLTQVAISEGQDIANTPLYPNYAIYDSALSSLYGDNVASLQAIKAQYDPDNVMALAGGWKF